MKELLQITKFSTKANCIITPCITYIKYIFNNYSKLVTFIVMKDISKTLGHDKYLFIFIKIYYYYIWHVVLSILLFHFRIVGIATTVMTRKVDQKIYFVVLFVLSLTTIIKHPKMCFIFNDYQSDFKNVNARDRIVSCIVL